MNPIPKNGNLNYTNTLSELIIRLNNNFNNNQISLLNKIFLILSL